MPTPTWDGESVTPEHVRRAAAIAVDTLSPALAADWSVPAGPLIWTCRDTIDHISDALGFYSGQLATRAPARRPRFRDGNPAAPVPDLLTSIETGAAIRVAVASAASPDARAYHRMGMADAEGFLAMACEEILVHTWDASQGLGLSMAVPDDLAAAVLHRIFPWAPTGCSAWDALLWCSDRIALADRGKIGSWGWHGPPIAEWDGQMRPAIVFPPELRVEGGGWRVKGRWTLVVGMGVTKRL